MNLNSKHEMLLNMPDYSMMWPVFIPLIVGLAPGLVYFFAITARRSGR